VFRLRHFPLAQARSRYPRFSIVDFLASGAQTSTNSGRSFFLEFRWAEGRYDRILGLVSNLSHPSDNLTGVSILNTELGPKRLELLHEMVPKAVVIELLVNPVNPNAETLSQTLCASADTMGLQLHVFHAKVEANFEPIFSPNNKLAERHLKEIETAIDAAGQKIVVFRASMPSEFESVFEKIVRDKADALLVTADGLYTNRRVELVALAAKYRVPAIYQWREFVESGGLVSYGTSLAGTQKQVGIYVGRILKGAKPADLPIVQPVTFELVLNLKTANALGLTVPPTLVTRADEVIE